jgi:hypothetical protein
MNRSYSRRSKNGLELMVCLSSPRLPSEQGQLMNRCVGLLTTFANIYIVFRLFHPPGGGMLARRVSASNIIKRKRQAEVARNYVTRLLERHGCSSITRFGPRPPSDYLSGCISALPPEREPSLARSTRARSLVAHLFSPRASELPPRCEPGTARAPPPPSGFVLWWQ